MHRRLTVEQQFNLFVVDTWTDVSHLSGAITWVACPCGTSLLATSSRHLNGTRGSSSAGLLVAASCRTKRLFYGLDDSGPGLSPHQGHIHCPFLYSCSNIHVYSLLLVKKIVKYLSRRPEE